MPFLCTALFLNLDQCPPPPRSPERGYCGASQGLQRTVIGDGAFDGPRRYCWYRWYCRYCRYCCCCCCRRCRGDRGRLFRVGAVWRRCRRLTGGATVAVGEPAGRQVDGHGRVGEVGRLEGWAVAAGRGRVRWRLLLGRLHSCAETDRRGQGETDVTSHRPAVPNGKCVVCSRSLCHFGTVIS